MFYFTFVALPTFRSLNMSFKGTGLWRTLSELTKNNRDDWFKAIERIAEGEEMPFVITKTLDQYSIIKEGDRKRDLGAD